MIFLPNKFERYTAALRNLVHISAIKKGKNQNMLKNMQKIFVAEAIFSKDYVSPINLGKLASQLLTAVYIKKAEKNLSFEFSNRLYGNYMLNPKLFTALLLTLCKDCEKIFLSTQNGKLVIKTVGFKVKNSLSTVKAMKGCMLYERFSKTAIFTFSFTATNKRETVCTHEYSRLSDPFSAVNIFIG